MNPLPPKSHPARPLETIILSKDRAAQLDSLLRSVRDHFHIPHGAVHVLHKASAEPFERGYDLLKRHGILPDTHWHAERDFRADILALLGALPRMSLVMILVDDDIVFRDFSDRALIEAFQPHHLFISLRASRDYRDTQPHFMRTEPCLEWRWRQRLPKRQVWNYPFSLDGNIFDRDVLLRLMATLDFKAPNSLEKALHRAKRRLSLVMRGRALAPTQAVIYNNPLNKVQSEWSTWNAGISADEINARFLAGERICNQPLYAAVPDSIHYFVPLTFEPSPGARA